MSFVELVILGIALAMDAFAITISNMFGYKGLTKRHMALMVLFFGVFQGLMPLIGFFAASIVSETITQFAGIITFAILGFIGGKMIWDAFHEEEDEERKEAAPPLPSCFSRPSPRASMPWRWALALRRFPSTLLQLRP